MTALTNVFLREYRERRSVLVASLVAGLLPFPLAMGVQRGSGFSFAESRDAGALVIALAIGLSVAMALGATILGRELTEGRLGFYYSRPIPSLSIWGGKLLAAYALALSAAGVSLVPTTLAGGGALRMGTLGGNAIEMSVGRQALSVGTLALLLMAVMALAIAVANAFSIMGRSRSPLLLLDLALASAVVGAASLGVRTILGTGGLEVLLVAAAVAPMVLMAGLLAAGAVQACVGRTDTVRSHRVLSATLWPILGAAALAFLGYAWWFGSVSPKDLMRVEWGATSPGGQWMWIGGPLHARGTHARGMFLLQPTAGRSFRTGVSPWASGVQFSENDGVAVWAEDRPRLDDAPVEIYALDLTSPGAVPRATRITVAGRSGWFSLSPDGSRVAVFTPADISICELATGKSLFSAGLAKLNSRGTWPRLAWAGNDRVRAYLYSGSGLPDEEAPGGFTIAELDVAAKKIDVTGSVAAANWGPKVSRRADRMVVRRGAGGGWTYVLCDARSGRDLADLATGMAGKSATILADGRAVVTYRDKDSLHLSTFSPDGAAARSMDLGKGRAAWIVRECGAGRVLVGLPKPGEMEKGSTVLADCGTGEVKGLGDGLPLGWSNRWGGVGEMPVNGSSVWLTDGQGSLVKVDVASGARTVVIQGRGGAGPEG